MPEEDLPRLIQQVMLADRVGLYGTSEANFVVLGELLGLGFCFICLIFYIWYVYFSLVLAHKIFNETPM